MIRAVLFDLDGTLLDRDSSVLAFVASQHDRLSHHFGHIPKDTYVKRFLDLDNHGYRPKDVLYQTLVSEHNITSVTWQELLADFHSEFDPHCVGYPNLHETLSALRQRNLLLGLITNGSGPFQQSKLTVLGIEHYFDTVLISEVEGIKKPNPVIFERALERLGVTAEETLFVGDHPVLDVEGSHAVGMAPVWKRNSHHPEPTLAHSGIDDLSEILALLD